VTQPNPLTTSISILQDEDKLILLANIFITQPTFLPPIQVGFLRAMFSTKHAVYQIQKRMISVT